MINLDFLLEKGFKKEEGFYVSLCDDSCYFIIGTISDFVKNNDIRNINNKGTYITFRLISDILYIKEKVYDYETCNNEYNLKYFFKLDVKDFINCFGSYMREAQLNKLLDV